MQRNCTHALVPLAWSGAGYILWIFGYCSNRFDIFLPLASANGSARFPCKFKLRLGAVDVTRDVVLSIGDLVAGWLCFIFWDPLVFFEFLFFFLLTKPTVYVGALLTVFPLLFFLGCTTTGRVALLLFRVMIGRKGIGSFLAAGALVPYNVSDHSCKVARPIHRNVVNLLTVVLRVYVYTKCVP